MNKRELLKEQYIAQKKCNEDERKNMKANYEAHHIAVLHDTLMENQENCILLKNDEAGKELLEYPEYTNWLKKQKDYDKLAQETDIKVVKTILKPIKQNLKKMSKDRILNEILKSVQ